MDASNHTTLPNWLLGEWEDHLLNEDKAAKTIYNYIIDVRIFAEWTELDEPTLVDAKRLIAYRAHLQAERRKPSTINRNIIAIKRYYLWLEDTGRITSNPTRTVRRVPKGEPKPRQLTPEEVTRMIQAAEQYGTKRDVLMFQVLIHTGVRAGELCNLQWQSFTLDRQPRFVSIEKGKGNKYRIVPVNDVLYGILTDYHQSLQGRPRPADYIFGNGKPMPQRSLDAIIKRFAALAEVEDVSAHDFRHYFAYQVIKTTPIHILKELLGHANIATTIVYLTPSMGDLVSAIQRLGDDLSN